jgi:protein-disulfide isomerase
MSAGRLSVPVGSKDHARGPADAAVTLVEYGDYECPHCAHAHPIVERVRAEAGDTLRFVFRNFPLTEIHPDAEPAAEAAEAAGARGKYWPMHDAIYEHQQDGPDALSVPALARYAQRIGLDAEAVVEEIAEDRYLERIRSDFMGGVRSGVNGTPTFFINGVRFDGDWTDVASFADAIAGAAAEV